MLVRLQGGAVGSTIEVEGREKDHHLLVSMYGVVFQAYIDKVYVIHERIFALSCMHFMFLG